MSNPFQPSIPAVDKWLDLKVGTGDVSATLRLYDDNGDGDGYDDDDTVGDDDDDDRGDGLDDDTTVLVMMMILVVLVDSQKLVDEVVPQTKVCVWESMQSTQQCRLP